MKKSLRIISTVSILTVLTLISIYVLGTILICGLIKNASWCAWWPRIPIAQLEDYIRTSGAWGIAVSIGIMIIHSFVPFPAEFVAIANGMLYGPLWGTVVTWTGAMLGAFLAFGLARKLGHDFVNRKLKEKNQEKLMEWIKNNGGTAILASRLIPVISFNLINYLAGVSEISPWTFAWTTALGILPLTIIMVVMGNSISFFSWKFLLLITAVGIGFILISKILYRRNKL